MPGENLTRSEARERAARIRVETYEINLDLASGEETFDADTTIRFRATAGADSFVDLVARSVESIELNGVTLNPADAFVDSRVRLPALAAENTLRIRSTQEYTNAGEGMHRFVDPVDGEVYLYTQFEIPDSRRVFPVWEQPDLKASFRFSVTAPAHWAVVSVQPSPEPRALGERAGVPLARWEFDPTPVLASYVTAIVAGPYHRVSSSLTSSNGRTIELGLFCRASLAEHLDAQPLFADTRTGFAAFEELFQTPYPFAKYDQIFVPEHGASAMENVGAVTFDESFLFRGTVAEARRENRTVTLLHELAHMWFGNLVTMRWWNDLWLNESFADYAATLVAAESTRWSDAWATAHASDKAWAIRQDQLPSTHPVAAEVNDLEDTLVNFDGITYAKGAAVLKQLVAWVGRDAFLRGISRYFAEHGFGNTEFDDLLRALEAASGRPLAAWAEQWLKTTGVNTLRVEYRQGAQGGLTAVSVAQSAHPEHPTLREHRIAIGCYDFAGGALRRSRRVEIDVSGARTGVFELEGVRRPALLLPNEDDLSYAKIRLDPESLATAEEHLGSIEDALTRALIWGSLWDATRDGEYPASRFARVVLSHAARETNSTTLGTILGQLSTAVLDYTDSATRATQVFVAAETLWGLARSAPAGSDQQLQFTTACASLVSGEAQGSRILGLVDGTAPLPGLVVENELRWELLAELAATGLAGETEIAAAQLADPSADGVLGAARARAAVPTRAAKRSAWEAAVERTDASGRTIEALAEGFGNVRVPELLREFIAPFHDALLGIWEQRAYTVAEELIAGLYPSRLADAEVVTAGQAWLDSHPDAPPTLRRLLAEPLADTVRAIRAQRCDRAGHAPRNSQNEGQNTHA